MTNKQRAALIAIATALASALGLGINGQAVAAGATSRVAAIEVSMEGVERRLDRIENKLDRLIERR